MIHSMTSAPSLTSQSSTPTHHDTSADSFIPAQPRALGQDFPHHGDLSDSTSLSTRPSLFTWFRRRRVRGSEPHTELYLNETAILKSFYHSPSSLEGEDATVFNTASGSSQQESAPGCDVQSSSSSSHQSPSLYQSDRAPEVRRSHSWWERRLADDEASVDSFSQAPLERDEVPLEQQRSTKKDRKRQNREQRMKDEEQREREIQDRAVQGIPLWLAHQYQEDGKTEYGMKKMGREELEWKRKQKELLQRNELGRKGKQKLRLWKPILEWVKSVRDDLEQRKASRAVLETVGAVLEQEEDDQALEEVLGYIELARKEVLVRIERTLGKGELELEPEMLEQRIEHDLEDGLMLKAIKQEIKSQCTHWGPNADSAGTSTTPLCCRRIRIFDGMVWNAQQSKKGLELRKSRLETELSTTFCRILRLSTWTPSTLHNQNLCKLLEDALRTLHNVLDNAEYHDCLRDFTSQHSALSAFLLDHAMNIIPDGDHEANLTQAELCKKLRQLAQKLAVIASTKAKEYQLLYDRFVANREHLSDWLDTATAGHGRSLVDNLTNSLKDMASEMYRQADYWNSQSYNFHPWPTIRDTYDSAVTQMPAFPPLQKADHGGSGIQPMCAPVTENTTPSEPTPQRVMQAARQVSTTFSGLQTMRPNKVQKFLHETEQSISKKMDAVRGYLQCAVEVAEKHLQSDTPPQPLRKMVVMLAKQASHVANRWSKLHSKVRWRVRILVLFSTPCQTTPASDTDSSVSLGDYGNRMAVIIDVASQKHHPYLIDSELCLRDMKQHLFSLRDFWAHTADDPAVFTTWLSEP